jgi:hypothetical protein
MCFRFFYSDLSAYPGSVGNRSAQKEKLKQEGFFTWLL